MNLCNSFLRLLVFVFVATQLLLAEGRSFCEENAKDSCVTSGRWQLHFKNKLSLDERPKCKTTSKKETLKLQWDMPQGANGSATVFCFLFSPDSIEHISHGRSSSPSEELNVFDGVLNTTALPMGSRRTGWKCDFRLPPGIWIPLLGYPMENDQTDEGKEKWMFSEMNQNLKIVRPKIGTVRPRLLFANTKATIDVQGRFIDEPAQCQVIRKGNARRSRSVHASITNNSLATCTVEGEEGLATLLFSWSKDCSMEFDIEFLSQPIVSHHVPERLPSRGSGSIELHLQSGRKDVENDIALFLPSEVIPTAQLTCIPNETFPGRFTIVSDNDWTVNITIPDLSAAVPGSSCNVSLSLNGRDYFQSKQNLLIDGPVVRFVSRKEGVVRRGRTRLAVELDSPVTLPTSVTLNLTDGAKFDRFVLRESVVTWSPGEFGIKYFVIEDKVGRSKKQNRNRFSFVGELNNPVNCDIHRWKRRIKLFLTAKNKLPFFKVSSFQILYPPSPEFFSVNISLTRGSSRLGSVLQYEVTSKQLNSRCSGEETVDFVPRDSSWLHWKSGEQNRLLPVRLFWDDVQYCDEIGVYLKLTSVRTATVEQSETLVAVIYGTPKGFCRPGMVRTKENKKILPFEPNNAESLSLADVKIEGKRLDNHVIQETALVPPFLANRAEYTAMIPHDLRDIRLMLYNKGSQNDVWIKNTTCLLDNHLSWEETVGEPLGYLQTEVILGTPFSQCQLQIQSLDLENDEASAVASALSEELDEEISYGDAPVPFSEPERKQTAFDLEFLKLSDPRVALLDSVDVRNATHVITLCGPKDAQPEGKTGDAVFERIEGYPKHSCHVQRINYVHETLEGTDLFVIPHNSHPEQETTRIEVSGRFLHDIHEVSGQGMKTEESAHDVVLATAFDGIRLDNASLSFDIRVTAEDNVTSNLYRFVYGKADSLYQLYAAGSSFDMEHSAAEQAKNETNSTLLVPEVNPVPEERWCDDCPTGTFSLGADSTQCALCEPGHFSDQPGSSHCDQCPEGTFTYTWGSEMCRPCMFGSAANQRGSRYCQLCPDGYTTSTEGAAHCTVPVESTDLSRYYAVIASFDVVLNGTSLEEIERLGASVHAPGLVVLKMLIRTDVADALNISVGDVAVKKVAPVGRHALSIDVDTTFKVKVAKDAEPDEVDRKVKATLLHGDNAVKAIADDPDRVLKRTTKVTHTHAKFDKNSKKIRASDPDDWDSSSRIQDDIGVICPIVATCVFVASVNFLCCVRSRKRRLKKQQWSVMSWVGLQERSGSSSGESETQVLTAARVRYRNVHRALEP